MCQYPLTVYGKGQQRKPLISFEDAVGGLAQLALNDVDERSDGHMVYKKVTPAISIVKIAETIAEVAQDHGVNSLGRGGPRLL